MAQNRISSPGLVAVLCASVGATWTVELHEFDPDTRLGPLVEWISTGVPNTQPEPDEPLVREMLADRGFHLYPDPDAGPSTENRRSIGYVYGDLGDQTGESGGATQRQAQAGLTAPPAGQ
jgi:hypothetical protein